MITAGESVCDLRNSLSQWLKCCCLEEHLTKGKYKSIAWCAVCSLGHNIMVLITETLILFSSIRQHGSAVYVGMAVVVCML